MTWGMTAVLVLAIGAAAVVVMVGCNNIAMAIYNAAKGRVPK